MYRFRGFFLVLFLLFSSSVNADTGWTAASKDSVGSYYIEAGEQAVALDMTQSKIVKILFIPKSKENYEKKIYLCQFNYSKETYQLLQITTIKNSPSQGKALALNHHLDIFDEHLEKSLGTPSIRSDAEAQELNTYINEQRRLEIERFTQNWNQQFTQNRGEFIEKISRPIKGEIRNTKSLSEVYNASVYKDILDKKKKDS